MTSVAPNTPSQKEIIIAERRKRLLGRYVPKELFDQVCLALVVTDFPGGLREAIKQVPDNLPEREVTFFAPDTGIDFRFELQEYTATMPRDGRYVDFILFKPTHEAVAGFGLVKDTWVTLPAAKILPPLTVPAGKQKLAKLFKGEIDWSNHVISLDQLSKDYADAALRELSSIKIQRSALPKFPTLEVLAKQEVGKEQEAGKDAKPGNPAEPDVFHTACVRVVLHKKNGLPDLSKPQRYYMRIVPGEKYTAEKLQAALDGAKKGVYPFIHISHLPNSDAEPQPDEARNFSQSMFEAVMPELLEAFGKYAEGEKNTLQNVGAKISAKGIVRSRRAAQSRAKETVAEDLPVVPVAPEPEITPAVEAVEAPAADSVHDIVHNAAAPAVAETPVPGIRMGRPWGPDESKACLSFIVHNQEGGLTEAKQTGAIMAYGLPQTPDVLKACFTTVQTAAGKNKQAYCDVFIWQPGQQEFTPETRIAANLATARLDMERGSLIDRIAKAFPVPEGLGKGLTSSPKP